MGDICTGRFRSSCFLPGVRSCFNGGQRPSTIRRACGPTRAVPTVYRAGLDTGLTEYEYDHVLVGEFSGEPLCNPQEVDDWRWISPEELKADMEASPQKYSAWFKIIIGRYFDFVSR